MATLGTTPYSTKIIKAGALLDDTRVLLAHWDTARSTRENLEETRLNELRAQKTQTGATGAAARQADRAIEVQEDLLAELRDFRNKLEGVRKLDLTPDLDDGVVLTIAPLWELVPWKVAKQYWDELLAGKYAWSSIGKQLRAKGLVK
jgi:hypothetical protein